MAALHPAGIEQLCPLDDLPVAKEVRILHDEDTIVAESMLERRKRVHPLRRPLLRPVRPAARPFGGAPRVPDLEEFLASELHRFDHGVRVIWYSFG